MRTWLEAVLAKAKAAECSLVDLTDNSLQILASIEEPKREAVA